ncbi:MAG TPA: phosphatase PAP2 family protein [Ktedonobacteraceae bacterium]|jgi:undecaprenyl-diphosphatase
MSFFLQLNYALFQAINGHAGEHPWLNTLMVFCANDLIFLLPLVMLLMWGRPVTWRARALNNGELEVLRNRRATVLWVAFACLAAYALNLSFEQFLFEPRPFIAHHVNLLIAHAADDSFPSDHTAWAFAVGGMFLLQWLAALRMARGGLPLQALAYPGLITLLALGMGCLIGFARVFVGVHYPGDILGGALDGLIAACAMTLLRSALSRPTNAVLRFAGSLHLA